VCGLAGILQLDGGPVSHAVLARMTDAVAHRGPDAEGFYVAGALGFGHRRLAIQDPTPAGQQPMATLDGRYVLSYNGEVLNYRELRVELEALGHRFRSRSDTEVVLAALEQWGTDALVRFNGMFALCLWDTERRELLLARDRYGIKPLYVARRGDTVLFGSEVKALLAHPALKADLDLVALREYLTFQNLFTDRTLFAGVQLLPPATFTRLALGCEPEPPRRYWDFEFAENGHADDGELLEELDRLLTQAVSRHLISDVPVATYLSGGMDSGSITAIASRQLPDLKTFTVGFDMHSASGLEMAFDERQRAEHLSYLFGTEHYQMVLKAGDMERVLPRLVWHLEDLRVGQSYPNFYAAQLASRFGKVVLSGAGGDELFGGYPWRYYRAVINDDFEHYIDKYYDYWQRLLDEETMPRVLAPVWSEVADVSTREILRGVFPVRPEQIERPQDYVNLSLYLEARTFLHGLLLVEDKLSMAHGLETRLPFLDNELVEFAQSLPVRVKLGKLDEIVRVNENEPGAKAERFYQRSGDGKMLLRRAMSRHLPEVAVSRAKQGFSGPDASWFRGESIDYVRRMLLARDARIYEWLDADTVHLLVDDHLGGRQNRRLLIWSLLCLEEWSRRFLT
jgi:asparagine synthase (glutamine-hydrolysing)